MHYYVAPNGADTNDGSRRHPFATIRKAAEVVNPGDTVIVRDGTYTDLDKDGAMVPVRRSGKPGAPVTFRAEHQWRAVLDGPDGARGQSNYCDRGEHRCCSGSYKRRSRRS